MARMSRRTKLTRKTKIYMVIAAILAVALIFTLAALRAQSKKSRAIFEDLSLRDIDYIEETYGGYPPYKLAREEQEKLVGYLQKIKVSKSEQTWMEYDGANARMFVLHMTDGKKTTVGVSSPLVVVDETTYKTIDFGLCQEISRLYYSHVDAIRAESKPIL